MRIFYPRYYLAGHKTEAPLGDKPANLASRSGIAICDMHKTCTMIHMLQEPGDSLRDIGPIGHTLSAFR